MMKFSEKSLLPLLPELNGSGKFWIAYSGGLDSHVLLQAISKVLPSSYLYALHINHGLSANADEWQSHCEQVCLGLDIKFESHSVSLDQDSVESLENLARKARYSVFNECVGENDYLLMAHHQNDQAETMLYRLMRGTGPRGLGGMRSQRSLDISLSSAQLVRPLLNFTRIELEEYAKSEGLKWIEDESNQDTDFDRNFLRQKVLPLLSQRWPGFESRWQRTADLCTQADHLQTILGQQDLLQVQTAHVNRLNISKLEAFDELRQRNLLRVWLMNLGKEFGLTMPDYRSLQRILSEVIPASEDAQPLVSWSKAKEQVDIRRFAGELYALKASVHESKISLSWNLDNALNLPNNCGTLSLQEVSSSGVELSNINQLRISFREGGEEAKPAGRKTRPLKKIFQDYSIPPWLRNNVPLIYNGDELVAVADLFICEKWQSEKGKKLYRFNWEKSDIHCGY